LCFYLSCFTGFLKALTTRTFKKMAEKEGFEPSIQFPIYTLSRGTPSTTRPLLHANFGVFYAGYLPVIA
jgi:hypothetical protein